MQGKYRRRVRRLLAPLFVVLALPASAHAAPSANLDQCANGPLSAPNTCDLGTEWENGNLNDSKSHYLEGDSVPYRVRFDDLTVGSSYSFTIAYDTTKSGKHALDYLRTYNASETGANPCAGVTGCNLISGSNSTFAIPADPLVPGTIQQAGSFTLFNGTITSVSGYTLSGSYAADSTTTITVTFTAGTATPVLAWAGHIATRADWGPGSSAAAISGSPFHTARGGGVGNGAQDRSLSAGAVLFPASVTVVKDAQPDAPDDFAFSTTGGSLPASFSLDDDADGTLPSSVTFADILSFGTHTVTETPAAGWSLSSLSCNESGGTANSTTSGTTATLRIEEAETLSCTFVNTRQSGTLRVVKALTPASDGGTFNLAIDGTTHATGGDGADTGAQTVTAGSHTVSETAAASTSLGDYDSSIDCRNGTTQVAAGTGTSLAVPVGGGESIVCTITNTRRGGTLEVVKALADGDPGTFDLLIDGTVEKAGAGHDGTTGAKQVSAGSHSVSEAAAAGSSLADYDSSIRCVDGQGTVVLEPTAGTSANVVIGSDQAVKCTISNARLTGELEVIKELAPSSDPGRFDLQIDGATEKSGAGDGEGTGLQTVNTGSHSFGEVAAAGTSLADYASSVSCVNGAGDVLLASTPGTSGSVNVARDAKVTCTITNTRRTGQLKVVKALSPESDPGSFALRIDGSTEATGGHGTDTGFETVNTGSHTVSELAAAGTDLSDYTSSVRCVDGDGTELVAPTAGTSANVNVADGAQVTCTITNTRKTGTLRVVKSLAPSGDPGTFNLRIDGTTLATGGDGADTTAVTVPTGSHTVSETAAGTTDLDDYRASIRCVDGEGDEVLAPAQGTSAAVSVGEGQAVTCTITNTRRTGTLTVVKQLAPAADPGRFDLLIDGATEKAAAGDGEGTGPKTVVTGTHTVAEAAATGTDLDDYRSSVRCVDGDEVVLATTSGTSASVSVGDGANVVCTFTNIRETGELRVVKQLSPSSDPGRFDLQIDGATEKAGAGDGEGSSFKTLNTGTHSVGEIAAGGTSLSDYSSAIRCVDADDAVVLAATSGTSANVAVGDGQQITCTITNTRRTGTLTVVKNLEPDGDPGRFDLKIDGTTEKAGAGDGASTRAKTVPTGTHTVSESAVSPASISDYDRAIRCVDGDQELATGTGSSLEVTVAADADVVCTITNTRRKGTLTVRKDLAPDDDPGRFDLKIDGTTEKAAAGDGEDTGAKEVAAGQHTVSEAAASGTTASEYVSTYRCIDGSETIASGSGTSGTVDVGSDRNVVCTFTNVRKSRASVLKTTNGSVLAAITWTFTLRKAGGSLITDTTAADGSVDFAGTVLEPGAQYTVCEIGLPAAWSATWTLNGSGVTPVNPNSTEDLGERCFTFTVESGRQYVFRVNNVSGGGGQRTIGYWKNWNRCSKGNQSRTAAKNGGAANGFYLVEDLLPVNIGRLDVTGCSQAVKVLSKQDQQGKNRAGDAAYSMAAQLLAATLNVRAGASTCDAALTAIADAEALLDQIGWTGAGSYLAKDSANRSRALALASTLDRYNNGLLCL